MMDPYRVVRIISMLAPFLFEAPSTFRIHLSSWSACSVVPRVKSAMKLAKTRSLIVVLSLYLSP